MPADGGTGMPPQPPPPGPAEPAPLPDRADTLLMSGSHACWSLAAGDEAIEDSFAEAVVCAGARCVSADGTVTAARDLLNAAAAFEATETLPGLSLTVSTEVTSYRFWGEHGYAALLIGAGPLEARIDGTVFAGDFSTARAWAAGDAAGTGTTGNGYLEGSFHGPDHQEAWGVFDTARYIRAFGAKRTP